jgi:hypothetical protein
MEGRMSEGSRVLRKAGVVAGGLVVGAAAAATIGVVAWRRTTARRLDLLADATGSRGPHVAPSVRDADLAALPAPVARYFALVFPEGQRRIAMARIRWEGEMRLGPDASWSPFDAEQHFTVAPPGFVWDAAVRMMPLVPVRGRNSYIAGQGKMLGRLGGVATVVSEGGTPEMAESALVRWLGEAAWFPAALLPGEGVTWEAVDDSTARATVTDGAVHVSGEFHFGSTGEMTRMTAMRYRDVDGESVLTPFEGRYGSFERREGVMIPTTAEVAWLLPEGRFAYWRGGPIEVSYDGASTR